jgi:hypothetical protein
MEDQVVAELGLGEEQPMLAAGLLSLACGKEGCETCEPFLAAGHQVGRANRRVLGGACVDKGVRASLKIDALLAHPVWQPMKLIEADASRGRHVGALADKHPSPLPVIDVKVVLDDPSIGDLKVPAVCPLVADSDLNARRVRAP